MNKYFKFAVVLVSAIILAFVFASALLVGLVAMIAMPLVAYFSKRNVVVTESSYSSEATQSSTSEKVLEAEFTRVEVKD